MNTETFDPRYPVGTFRALESHTLKSRNDFVSQIEDAPERLREAVRGLSNEQLEHPYRDGGWSVRQVVHHVADSHLNAYIRFKLAATEEEPRISTYDEKQWAQLADGNSDDITVSLTLLAMLHRRWIIFLRSLDDEQFNRRYIHPELGPVSLDRALALYAWHGRHHVAHITTLRERMGWE